MGQATGILLRERIIQLKQENYTLEKISEELSLTYSNVRTIWGRYQKEGISGLQTSYSNCGKSKPSSDNVVYRASLWLKHLHAHWGTPRVHTGLQSRYGVDVPTIRTLNRWYKDAQLTKPRSKINRVTIGKSTAAHNIWQVDAKENLTLGDGQESCYLTIVDEKSGAWLASLVFPLWTYLSSTP
jgi:transposase